MYPQEEITMFQIERQEQILEYINQTQKNITVVTDDIKIAME